MNTSQNQQANPSGLGGKYLTFIIANEHYGLEILKVREIIGVLPITPLPHSPPHVVGVINLRGRVIPVTDMRLRMKMPPTDTTRETCIIVVELEDDGDSETMGIVVDEVAEVCDIRDVEASTAPPFGSEVDSQHLLGVGRLEDRVVLLMDIDKVLRQDDVEVLSREASRTE